MERYVIESPHTKDECIKALDEMLSEGPSVLSKFDWGCTAGDHTGYAIIDASSESDALNLVPRFIRNKARVVKVGKFTPEQIKSFH
ncbi:MAG TPA: hypothetical protein VFF47_03805 [Nitrospirota bacterium]|nr:hypothetical protein [Nitrospirota bacterium]